MPKILIIDEEESSRELLTVYSELLGYEAIATGEQAACCDNSRFECTCTDDDKCADVLLVNQKSSKSTGLEFIQKRISGRCKVPIHNIAILSRNLSPVEFKEAKKLGCHCLQKPISFEILQNWLKQLESQPQQDKSKLN